MLIFMSNIVLPPRAGISNVPRTFRARKAIRKTTTCLFCKAGLLICSKGNKNKNNCQVSCLVLKVQRELRHPKYARKVSGLSRNRPLAVNDFFRNKFSDEMKVTGVEREMGVKIGLKGNEAHSLQRPKEKNNQKQKRSTSD